MAKKKKKTKYYPSKHYEVEIDGRHGLLFICLIITLVGLGIWAYNKPSPYDYKIAFSQRENGIHEEDDTIVFDFDGYDEAYTFKCDGYISQLEQIRCRDGPMYFDTQDGVGYDTFKEEGDNIITKGET